MRDITKSMLSYTWAMSIFGVQQTANLFRRGGRQDNRAAEVFDDVTGVLAEQFDDTLKATFRAGDNLQRGFVDLMLGGMATLNPNRWTRFGGRASGPSGDRATSDSDPGWSNSQSSADDRMPPGATFGRGPSETKGCGCQSAADDGGIAGSSRGRASGAVPRD